MRRGRTIRGERLTRSGRRVRVRIEPQDIYAILVSRRPQPRVARAAARRGARRGARRRHAARAPRRRGLGGVADGSSAGSRCSATTRRQPGAVPRHRVRGHRVPVGPRRRAPTRRADQADRRAARRARRRRSRRSTAQTAAGSGILGLCLGWPNATPAPGPDTAPFPPCRRWSSTAPPTCARRASDAAAVAGAHPGRAARRPSRTSATPCSARDPSGLRGRRDRRLLHGHGVTPCPAADAGRRADHAPRAQPRRAAAASATCAAASAARSPRCCSPARTCSSTRSASSSPDGRTRFGGLRGGTISRSDAGVTLRKVVVVPGVPVSGRFPEPRATRA